jgi:hypothetical protein
MKRKIRILAAAIFGRAEAVTIKPDQELRNVALGSLAVAATSAAVALPADFVRPMADIATHAWKAQAKMLDAASGEVREEMKRVHRHIEFILAAIEAIGVEIKDHTGDAFDYGLPLKVVTTQPTADIVQDKVIETIKPTIYWRNQIIQMGEVVLATPTDERSSA